MEADRLDQRSDVRPRALQRQRAALGAEALREAGEIDHQRGVCEVQFREVDDHVPRRLQRGRDRPTAPPAGRSILIPRDPQDRQLLVEVNDPGKLVHTAELVQAPDVSPYTRGDG